MNSEGLIYAPPGVEPMRARKKMLPIRAAYRGVGMGTGAVCLKTGKPRFNLEC